MRAFSSYRNHDATYLRYLFQCNRGRCAAVIYLIIALATGIATGPALWMAVLLGAATFVIAFIITKTITHARGRRVAFSDDQVANDE